MQTNELDLLKILPIRVRVGITLALCNRLLLVLEENERAISTSKAALSDGWKWVEGVSVSATQIYSHMEFLSDCETSAVREEEINAICAIEVTVQYVSWHAFRIELKGLPPQTRPVPNDMGDVTENILGQIIDFARKADCGVLSWINKLLSERSSKIWQTGPDELGPSVSKQYFVL